MEQRIVEAAGHLPPGGMVTGWAALRLLRGGFFDGVARDGSTEFPVTLLLPHSVRLAARPVVVIDMTAAAEITSPHRVAAFLASDGPASG